MSVKVSGLPALTGDLNGGELFVVVKNGVADKATAAQVATYMIQQFSLTSLTQLLNILESQLPSSLEGLGVGDWWSNDGILTRVKAVE